MYVSQEAETLAVHSLFTIQNTEAIKRNVKNGGFSLSRSHMNSPFNSLYLYQTSRQSGYTFTTYNNFNERCEYNILSLCIQLPKKKKNCKSLTTNFSHLALTSLLSQCGMQWMAVSYSQEIMQGSSQKNNLYQAKL